MSDVGGRGGGLMSLDELKRAAAAGEIDTVVAAQTDMQGRLMGKRFHVDCFLDSAWRGTHGCDYLLATDMEMTPVDGYRAAGWARGYGDYVMRPDMSTLRRLPWQEGAALVLCDVLSHDGSEEVAHSPRAILKKQEERLREKGMILRAASELEFFLFRESFEEARDCGYRGLSPFSPYNEDYHIFQTAKEEFIMRAIRNGLQGAGVPVECTKGEASAGQAEINVRHAPSMEMADRHVIVKQACKEIAHAKGRAVSFMAKWSDNAAGNSCHVHMSLTDLEGAPLFCDSAKAHGMSDLMRHWLAGLLRHAEATMFFLAPNINSYKRFVAGTFAPTAAVWSADNRTAGYRLCAAGEKSVRVECRVGGADLNPYLAAAALAAAGLDGVENKLELEKEFTGDAYQTGGRRLPVALREAAAAFENSEMLRATLGDEVVDHYAHAARWEQSEYDRRVTDWEIHRGFERS